MLLTSSTGRRLLGSCKLFRTRFVDSTIGPLWTGLTSRSLSVCTSPPVSNAKKPRRRGYVVTCAIGHNQTDSTSPILSDACLNLRQKFNRDIAAMVEGAARPAKPGQMLLLPGGLGRDSDGYIVDLCVIGVAADAKSGGLAERVQAGAEPLEPWEAREDRRTAIRLAVTALRDLGCRQVMLDSGIAPAGSETDDAMSIADIAEAAQSAALVYRRSPPKRPLATDDADSDETAPTLIGRIHGNAAGSSEAWDYGLTLGMAEARARDLMERPANLCTPDWFCRQAVEAALALGPNVEVTVHDEEWIRQRGMGGLIAVSKGSKEPPRFLVAKYNGRSAASAAEESHGADVCLIGKGVTFDSGGISIKPSANMADMRGDMGGAAVALSSFLAACQLRLPLRLVMCAPLCENMPDGGAVKPGDVIDLAGGSITCRVDNTDAEGRLILADALHYATNAGQPPSLIVDLATLTGAIAIALGGQRAGLFANQSARLRGFDQRLLECGFQRGDPLHPMPTDRRYRAAVQDKSGLAHLSNIGTPDRMAGACTAAAFLSHFVPAPVPWMHVDMAGVMDSDGGAGTAAGRKMSGRPTRALVDFLRCLANAGLGK